MSAAAAAPTAINYVTWTVAIIGIGSSLIWNLVNTVRSNSLAQRLRVEQYRSSQWTRIRGQIDKALDDLIGSSTLVVDEAIKLDDSDTKLNFFNRIVVNSQDELCTALREADLSSYCEGDTWEACASGTAHGSETSWDLVLHYITVAQEATCKADRIAALSKIRTPIQEIRRVVNDRMRVQDHELDPHRQ